MGLSECSAGLVVLARIARVPARGFRTWRGPGRGGGAFPRRMGVDHRVAQLFGVTAQAGL